MVLGLCTRLKADTDGSTQRPYAVGVVYGALLHLILVPAYYRQRASRRCNKRHPAVLWALPWARPSACLSQRQPGALDYNC